MEDAVINGFIIAGPILCLVAVFFALSISASPFYSMLGKAVAWPISPVAGLISGEYFAEWLLPSWGDWGVAWFFGPGFFLVWMVIGILAHEDVTHLYGDWARKLWYIAHRKLNEQQALRADRRARYKAYSNRRSKDGERR